MMLFLEDWFASGRDHRTESMLDEYVLRQRPRFGRRLSL